MSIWQNTSEGFYQENDGSGMKLDMTGYQNRFEKQKSCVYCGKNT